MEVTNLHDLKIALQSELKYAMHEVNSKIYNVLKKEVSSFYIQGKPKIYVRTGALGNSPKTTPLSINGNRVEFKAYLDQSYSYQMPNQKFIQRGYASYFTTPMVLENAENHTAHILGKPGFWARSESQFQKILDDTIRSHFS